MTDTPKPGTKLPWKRESYFIVGDVPNGRPGGEVIVQCSTTVPQLRDSVTGERNAAYIVHACNRLPELEAKLAEAMEVVGLLHPLVCEAIMAGMPVTKQVAEARNRAVKLLGPITEESEA